MRIKAPVWFEGNRDKSKLRKPYSSTDHCESSKKARAGDLISQWSFESLRGVSLSLEHVSAWPRSQYTSTLMPRGSLSYSINQEKLKFLKNALSNSRASANKATYTTWFCYFETQKGKNHPYQVEAMLSYWFSYYIFPGAPEDRLNTYVFPLNILLCGG